MADWHDRNFGHLPWYARDWGFYRNEKVIGRLPILRGNGEQTRETARYHGMQQSFPKDGTERWQHQDGTYIEMVYGRNQPRIGWSVDGYDHDLGRLPYNNRLG
jgi:hypothetical protein